MGEEKEATEAGEVPEETGAEEEQGSAEESLIYEAQKARDNELETK